jgi:uncharacterized protein with HEPN domain
MSEREWRFYVQGMLGFADNVIAYSDGLTLEAFESTGLYYSLFTYARYQLVIF